MLILHVDNEHTCNSFGSFLFIAALWRDMIAKFWSDHLIVLQDQNRLRHFLLKMSFDQVIPDANNLNIRP